VPDQEASNEKEQTVGTPFFVGVVDVESNLSDDSAHLHILFRE
jgi:hypothetical protein